MFTPAQAEGVFDVLVDELDVDLALRQNIIHALEIGAERIQFCGFSSAPKRQQARLILLRDRPQQLKSPDKDKLSDEQYAAAVRAGQRIDDVLLAPPIRVPRGEAGRMRLSPLAA